MIFPLRGLLLLSLAACASQTPEPETAAAPVFKDVTYRFSEQATGADKTLSGTVRILGNVVVIDAQPGPCRNLPSQNYRSTAYQCAEVLFVADLSTATPRVTYSTTRTVREPKSTCVRYETTASGMQRCAQTQTDMVDRQVAVTGQLRLTPDATP